MPRIPLYERQQVASPRVGGAQASRASVAPFEALAQLGGTVANIGADYAERKKELKLAADESDYKVRLKTLESDLIQAKNKAMLEDNVHYQDVLDKVYRPILDKFNADSQTRGYAKESLTAINQRWGIDRAVYEQREIADREKLELTDLTERMNQEAQGLLFDGTEDDIEKANQIYSKISGIVGDAKANEMRSDAVYGNYLSEASSLDVAFHESRITPNEYMELLNDMDARLSSDDKLLENHRRAVRTTVDGKRRYVATRANREAEQRYKEFERKIASEAVTYSDLQGLRPYLGNVWVDAWAHANETGRIGDIVEDRDAREGVKTFNEFQKGQISYEEYLNEVKDIGGVIGSALVSAGELVVQDLAKQDDFLAFKARIGGQERMVARGRTSDFMGRLSNYTQAGQEDIAVYATGKMREFQLWRLQYPEATDEEYEEWVGNLFKSDAKRMATSLIASQQRRIDVQSFDTVEDALAANLPSGTEIVINGRRAIVE